MRSTERGIRHARSPDTGTIARDRHGGFGRLVPRLPECQQLLLDHGAQIVSDGVHVGEAHVVAATVLPQHERPDALA